MDIFKTLLLDTPTTAQVVGTVPVNQGGTGETTYTDGQLLIGNSATSGLTKATLTAGSNITITNGNGSITIAATGGGGGGGGTVTSIDVSGGTTGLTTSGGPVTTSGTITLAGTLGVANGGTGLTSGTSGGVLAFTASGTLASSSALASNALVVGGGAGAAPSTITTGTGVVTALGVNTGTSGAFVVNGGALGTPSSGTVTNLTGTASININGTVGATTPASGKFTTLDASGNVGFDGGTFIFNDSGADKDFRIEGDTAANLFFSDASTDRIGINEGTPLARLDVNGNYAANITAVSALDIDCATANYFTKTIAADSTFTFSNPPSSRAFAFALEVTHTSGAITWPASVKWPKDTAPVLTTGKTHIFIFVTDDGGTRWRGAPLVDYVN